jgi:hypothetical protein
MCSTVAGTLDWPLVSLNPWLRMRITDKRNTEKYGSLQLVCVGFGN